MTTHKSCLTTRSQEWYYHFRFFFFFFFYIQCVIIFGEPWRNKTTLLTEFLSLLPNRHSNPNLYAHKFDEMRFPLTVMIVSHRCDILVAVVFLECTCCFCWRLSTILLLAVFATVIIIIVYSIGFCCDCLLLLLQMSLFMFCFSLF